MRWMALVLLFAASCSNPQITLPLEEPSEPPGKDEARVVVYRPSSRNERKPYAVFDDEELVGFAQSGAWFEVRCTPGEHFFYLRGVSDHAVRATLQGGKTYYLRVDSIPQWFWLQLRLLPIVPGSDEFLTVEEDLAGLQRCEAVDVFVDAYEDRFADPVADRLGYFRNEGREECGVLKAEEGR
jgi:hypothetical protein